MKKVLWEELRRSEFEEAVRGDAIVIIPVGSMEQHGNHLPVNTDTSCCFTVAVRAAQAIDEFPVLVLPPVWVSYSPHHMTYPGTITLKFQTFVEVLTQIASCVHAQGFKKIVFLNGHGGNTPTIAALRVKLPSEDNIPAIGYTYWELPSVPEQLRKISQSDKGSIGHAGEMETSLQLYLQPALVDKRKLKWVPGVLGDPSKGTRDKGERLVNAAVDALVELLRGYHDGTLDEDLPWRILPHGRKALHKKIL